MTSLASGASYTIDSVSDLNDLTNLSGKFNGIIYANNTFTLTTDLDLTGADPAGDGKGWKPIGTWASGEFFCGYFDGDGYTISNMTINRPTENYQGLFGAIDEDMDGAETLDSPIKNLAVIDANVIGASSVGIMVGSTLGSGIATDVPIKNCYVTGYASGTDNCYLGGFVGFSNNGYFLNCYADVTVSTIFSDCQMGGFLGYDTIGTDCVNCYSVGLVNNSGPVTGDTEVGGFIGKCAATYATDCFWDTQTSGIETDGTGGDATGKTTSQMKTEGTFTNWDFTNEWSMPADSYPELRVFGPGGNGSGVGSAVTGMRSRYSDGYRSQYRSRYNF
jgi:hypothetical protein